MSSLKLPQIAINRGFPPDDFSYKILERERERERERESERELIFTRAVGVHQFH